MGGRRHVEPRLMIEAGLEPIHTGELVDELVGVGENEFAISQMIFLSPAPTQYLGIFDQQAPELGEIVGAAEIAGVAVARRKAMHTDKPGIGQL